MPCDVMITLASQTADKLTVEVFPAPADGDILHAAVQRAVVPGGQGQEDDKLQLPSDRLIKQSQETLDGLVSCWLLLAGCIAGGPTIAWQRLLPTCCIAPQTRLLASTVWWSLQSLPGDGLAVYAHALPAGRSIADNVSRCW